MPHSKALGAWGDRTELNRSPYWVFGGSCEYLYWEHHKLIELIAASIYFDYPEFPNRRLSIGDSCPISGNCPQHPDTTHSNKMNLDTNYYTLGENNSTQYRPGGPGDHTYDVITKIWTKDPDEGRLNENFDWKRNLIFVLRIRQIFPDSYIITQRQIRDLLFDKARLEFGNDAYSLMSSSVKGDTGTNYAHHKHFHIMLKDEINWDFDVRNFYR